MAQDSIDTKLLSCSPSTSYHNGQGDEGNEGHEGHGSNEGHEGHEEEGSEQDCKGPLRQVRCLPWNQGQDYRWFDKNRLGEEQERKDCEQKEFGKWQEELRQHQGLDYCLPEGQEGTWCEGLRRYQEGLSSLQEGQRVLQLSMSARLQLRMWGYLRP